MQNCSLPLGLQILSVTVSDKMYIFFVSISKNTIEIFKSHFLNKICEIRKNVEMKNYFLERLLQILIRKYVRYEISVEMQNHLLN